MYNEDDLLKHERNREKEGREGGGGGREGETSERTREKAFQQEYYRQYVAGESYL